MAKASAPVVPVKVAEEYSVPAGPARAAVEFDQIDRVTEIGRIVPAKAAAANSGGPGTDPIEFRIGTSGATGETIIATT